MKVKRFVRVAMVVAMGLAVGACDLGKVTVNTTAGVLKRAQPSLNQESDYELAAAALPATLKTIEGFWIVSPDNADLVGLLTEGYCQYGTAFVEDDWEIAKLHKNIDRIAELNASATKIFTRCLNYALRTLGPRWQRDLFGTPDVVNALIASTSADQRDAMMWAAVALGSIINHNLDHVEIIAYLPTVKQMMARVIELDAKHKPADAQKAALPHLALGLVYSATSAAFGGDAKLASDEFAAALAATGDKFLLARALWGYRVGVMSQDRKLFHAQLVKVLETPPSVWPEQRLANEVAHRRARRYLAQEKDLFP